MINAIELQQPQHAYLASKERLNYITIHYKPISYVHKFRIMIFICTIVYLCIAQLVYKPNMALQFHIVCQRHI